MFQIPTVLTAQEILDKGFRRVRKAKGKGRTALERSKALSISRVDSFSETVRSSLRKVYESFPTMEYLSAFYWELIDILAGVDEVKGNLGSIRWAYVRVGEFAGKAKAAIRRSGHKEGVDRARKACYGRVSSLLEDVDGSLRFLNDVRNNLRRLPVVDPHMPTIVVAGSPNVGKSQLVRVVSSGRPTVASYPFTTLDLSLGHFELDGTRYQIMDTPGLLDRPLYKRNDIERKALVALTHLANVVIFLLDPTGTCGYPMGDQEALLGELKELFSTTPILEVENKSDLGPGTGLRIRVSALTGQGIDELMREVLSELTSPAPEGEPQSEAE
ncbi:MAG: 50S ribosome-binding GTPase [Candidatus Thermoplasmatota archaeon]|nr:50S ribosome-binding GTPase [Candidatus Thermoplasmatota archaeon]